MWKKGHAGIIIVILGFNPYQVTEWESSIVAAMQKEGETFSITRPANAT